MQHTLKQVVFNWIATWQSTQSQQLLTHSCVLFVDIDFRWLAEGNAEAFCARAVGHLFVSIFSEFKTEQTGSSTAHARFVKMPTNKIIISGDPRIMGLPMENNLKNHKKLCRRSEATKKETVG